MCSFNKSSSQRCSALKFFNESACNENTCMVCCGTTGNFLTKTSTSTPLTEKEIFDGLSKEGKKDYVFKKLLPTKTYCGMQHTDDYFYNETETSVDEFPWLVYILQTNATQDSKNHLRIEPNCAGTLISNLYVLSADDCRIYADFNETKTIDMVLGAHHIHKNVSCIDWSLEIEDCIDPSLRVSSSEWKMNGEVVLFRLNKKIDYSEYIRPICLPLQADELPTTGSLVMASGRSEEEFVKGKHLKLKKRMKYTVMSKKDCERYNPLQNLICGIPLAINTHCICRGDIGGPLMYRHKRNWFVVGLIIFETESCSEAQPATSLLLTPETVNWIIENIEP